MGRNGEGEFLCGLCQDYIPFIAKPFCRVCGQPADIDYELPDDMLECGWCRKKTYSFDQARSLGVYSSVLKELIHFFKYQNQPGAIEEVESLLQKYFQEEGCGLEGFLVVSVPLHFRKLKARGFDQSYVLAHSVSRILGLPLLERPLERVRDTPSQARKNRKERMENIKGAFNIVSPDLLEGEKILVVDDVFTTGATVNEVSKTLKRGKAGEVRVFTLARA